MNTLEITKKYIKPLFTRSYWQMMADYVGIGNQKKSEVIRDSTSLASFLGTRASHVAQTSLYGYLRTRAGTRYPALFENPDILKSINIAKWQIWLACVSDLALFTGQCLYHSGQLKQDKIAELVATALDQVLEETGEPAEAEPGHEGRQHHRNRIHRVAEHQGQHTGPDDLVDQGGHAGKQEEKINDGRAFQICVPSMKAGQII